MEWNGVSEGERESQEGRADVKEGKKKRKEEEREK